MVRTAALVLLAANAVYFGWSQGLLAPLGLGPDTGSEPQRLAQQIRPEALRVAQTSSAAAPAEPASTAAGPTTEPACLRAGPFDAAQADTLRQALAGADLPEGSWALDATATPTRWIVYMGKYADADALEKKRAELRALRVETAPVRPAALAPGLSLGVFTTAAGAQEHLAQLTRRGVRTARVVPETPEQAVTQLRLPHADEALRARVQPLAGKPLTPC
ncbi:hypothetical protein ASF43_22045 [Pseudorhodoferax sp. Leaf267]|nr:hypothetical protein [Pseudorhodoferax sp. Leaf267]KQP12333.1 hypothetical protein ASF43_22045 [Pseudorhodoferax sp. Leaf267]